MVTFLLRFADVAGLASSWRRADDLGRAAAMRHDVLAAAAAIVSLGEAAPTPAPGESVADAVARSLGGPLADAAGEERLATSLGDALLDARLAEALRAAAREGERVVLRVQPSPSIAGVPWPLLALPGGERLMDVADVSLLPPAAIVHDARRVMGSTPSSMHVRVLDPRIPGQPARGALGSVLGRPDPDAALSRALGRRLADTLPRVEIATALQRRAIDRDALDDLLHPRPASLLYAGHVRAALEGATRQTVLHLSCGAEVDGLAAPIGEHRPFAAADLLRDAVAGGARWPMPPRVALVACHSIGELAFDEALGVAIATVTAGADEVLATCWTMPTDAALDEGTPFSSLVLAADDVLRADDALLALCTWQRARREAWLASGAAADAPLWWAALTLLDARPTALD